MDLDGGGGGSGRQPLGGFEAGDRSEATFCGCYERLPKAQRYYSDAYAVYQAWLPPGRHRVGKGGLVTGTKGCIRRGGGRLKRLMQETTGYRKALWMLRGSLALLCLRPRKGRKAIISAF